QLFGGSVFGLIPRRFERTGSFIIDRTVVAERARLNSRMARLRPGAEAESGTTWYYARPDLDLPHLPVIVRSRLEKLAAEGPFVEAARGNSYVLYRISGSTANVDDGIERWWRPRAVVPAPPGKGVAGGSELAFYDRRRQEIVIGARREALPPEFVDDYVHLFAGRFANGADIAAARMADTHYWRGAQLAALVDYRAWYWSYRNAKTGAWSREASRWFWDLDVPLVADLAGDGVHELIAFR